MPGHDVIVVGAGSAGAVLAARLSEDESRSVLLVEAGPDYRSAETVAEMRSQYFPGIVARGGFHWPTLVARNTDSREAAPYVCGFGVGGSSSINAQAAIRPMPDDFAQWPAGWSWDDVLPSFIRLEADLQYGHEPYHGSDGPVAITRRTVQSWGPVDLALRDAALDAGHPWCEDLNAPNSTGVSPMPLTQRHGARVSTNDAYLEPARDRPNLQILGGALVDRVLIQRNRARGVRVRVDGRWRDELAAEIIVSAGAIHSPGILMRSGIGPASRLRSLAIPVVVDSPGVGANLREHPTVSLALALKAGASQSPSETDNLGNCYLRYGSASQGGNDLFILSGNLGWLVAALTGVMSTGRVDIVTSDPESSPDVTFRMLSEGRDLVRLRQGARHMFDLAGHPAVRSITDAVTVGTTIGTGTGVGTGVSTDDFSSDEDLDAWLLATCGEFHHPCGTCRMGDSSDPEAVVDSQGRVIGVSGLRVTDASIFPNVPRANTNLTSIMVAEHMSALFVDRE